MVNGNLPDGWEWSTLKHVSKEIYRYPTFYGMEHVNNGVPVIRGEHILSNGSISHDWSDYWFVTEEYSNKFPKTIVEVGDLIMSVRGRVGKIGIVDKPLRNAQVSPNCIRISTKRDRCTPKFLFFYLKSSSAQIAISNNVNATTIQTIKASALSTTPVPLPPLPEQERIVSRIEELFSDLEAGVAALERVRAGLKRYKASVLKAACEGKLLESRGVESSGELPEGWRWMRLDEVTENFDGKRVPVKASDRQNMQGEYPYYGASGIIDHVNDYLFDGDYLLIAEDGANLLSRSTPIAFQAHGKFWVNNHAHIVKTLDDMPLAYLENFINSLDLQFYVTGTAQPKLTQANLNKIPVPLPPLEEQRRIVAEVERRLSVVREVESAVEAGLARAARLRQSVLRSAFEGRL